MSRSAYYLRLALCSGLLWIPRSVSASALGDLMDAAGQRMPNVPEPPEPTREDDDNDRSERRNPRQEREDEEERQRQAAQWQQQQAEQERQQQAERAQQEETRRQEEMRQRQEEAARQEQLRQARLEQERRDQEERARQEALRRQREEEARQARLRAQAAAARSQWVNADAKNEGAFDDIFAASSGAGSSGNDPNVVDLTDATNLTPALLRGGGPRVSLRIKPPPLPEPEATVDFRGQPPEPPAPPPQWHLDPNGKLTDLGFAYASMYLKSKVDGLASIPELTKDALDLRKRLTEHCTSYLDNLFATARQAANPNADLGALSERTWKTFETAAGNFDEDARRGAQNAGATTSSGALPEGSSSAELGIGTGQAQIQDTQELKKWGDEHASDGS